MLCTVTININKNKENDMAEFKYEVTESIGVLSEAATGWSRQLNMVSWNDREPKLDIRDWAPEREKMAKGITLSKEEAIKLRDFLVGMDLE